MWASAVSLGRRCRRALPRAARLEFAVFQKVNVFDSWETAWGAVGGVTFAFQPSVPLGGRRMARGTVSMGCWRSPARSPGLAPSFVSLGVRGALRGGPARGEAAWEWDSRSTASVCVANRSVCVSSTHTSPSLLSRRHACVQSWRPPVGAVRALWWLVRCTGVQYGAVQ